MLPRITKSNWKLKTEIGAAPFKYGTGVQHNLFLQHCHNFIEYLILKIAISLRPSDMQNRAASRSFPERINKSSTFIFLIKIDVLT